MPKSSGGSGQKGRSGSGGEGGSLPDNQQLGEVFRAADEAKLQARADRMATAINTLNTRAQARETKINKMNSELARNANNYKRRAEMVQLSKNIRKEQKKLASERKGLIKVYDKFNKEFPA